MQPLTYVMPLDLLRLIRSSSGGNPQVRRITSWNPAEQSTIPPTKIIPETPRELFKITDTDSSPQRVFGTKPSSWHTLLLPAMEVAGLAKLAPWVGALHQVDVCLMPWDALGPSLLPSSVAV